MDIDKVVDILFLGMVLGACFAIALLKGMGYRKPPEETPGPLSADPKQSNRGKP